MILAEPVDDNITVKGLVITVGPTKSCTVTTAVAELVFPLASVAVNVTVFGPTLAQVNEVVLTVKEVILQLSEEPLLT